MKRYLALPTPLLMKYFAPQRLIYFLLLFLGAAEYAMAQEPEWVVGTTHSISFAEATATDATGNVYVTGSFRGTMSFGAITLTSAGYQDVFVAKLTPQGGYQWVAQAGGPYMNGGRGLTVDSAGRVFVTGFFQGGLTHHSTGRKERDLIRQKRDSSSATFGSLTLTSTGDMDVFVAKLTPAGIWEWATSAGGTDHDYGNGVAHMRLAGDFQLANLTYNRFGRALVGLHLAGAQLPSLEGCAFDSCYLAGVFVADQTANTAILNQVAFTLPPDATFPNTTQLSAVLAEPVYAFLRPNETVGIYAGPGEISVTNSTFSQPTTVGHTTYPYTATRYRQVGIRSLGITTSTYAHNTFEDLHTGVELSGMAGFETELTNNAFRNCEVGLWLGQPASQLGPSSNVYTQCNTFARTRVTTGTSYGIYAAAGADTKLTDILNDPISHSANPSWPLRGELRNFFAEASTGTGRQMVDVYNDAANPIMSYLTFVDLIAQLNATNVLVTGSHPTASPGGVRYDDCSDHSYTRGQQWRPVSPISPLDPKVAQYGVIHSLQVNPNPAVGAFTVEYTAPKSDNPITLCLTDALTGRVVREVPLNASESSITLTAPHSGLYQCQILLNGIRIGSTRLIVQQ